MLCGPSGVGGVRDGPPGEACLANDRDANKSAPDPREMVGTGGRTHRWPSLHTLLIFPFFIDPTAEKEAFSSGCVVRRPRKAFRALVRPDFGQSGCPGPVRRAIRYKVLALSAHTSSSRGAPEIESVDLGDKNKVRGLDRSGKSDLDPWLMWCMPNYRPHGPRLGPGPASHL